jgi:hypothetical protein
MATQIGVELCSNSRLTASESKSIHLLDQLPLLLSADKSIPRNTIEIM